LHSTAHHRTSRLPFLCRKRLSHYDDYTTAKQHNQAFFNTVGPFWDYGITKQIGASGIVVADVEDSGWAA